jgi:hypothetical protein
VLARRLRGARCRRACARGRLCEAFGSASADTHWSLGGHRTRRPASFIRRTMTLARRCGARLRRESRPGPSAGQMAARRRSRGRALAHFLADLRSSSGPTPRFQAAVLPRAACPSPKEESSPVRTLEHGGMEFAHIRAMPAIANARRRRFALCLVALPVSAGVAYALARRVGTEHTMLPLREPAGYSATVPPEAAAYRARAKRRRADPTAGIEVNETARMIEYAAPQLRPADRKKLEAFFRELIQRIRETKNSPHRTAGQRSYVLHPAPFACSGNQMARSAVEPRQLLAQDLGAPRPSLARAGPRAGLGAQQYDQPARARGPHRRVDVWAFWRWRNPAPAAGH